MFAGRHPTIGSKVGTGGSSFSVGGRYDTGGLRASNVIPLAMDDRGDVAQLKEELARDSGRMRLIWAWVISGVVAFVTLVSEVPVDQRLTPLELESEPVHAVVVTVVPESLRYSDRESAAGTGAKGDSFEDSTIDCDGGSDGCSREPKDWRRCCASEVPSRWAGAPLSWLEIGMAASDVRLASY